jgi:hypothetical protein
MNNQRLSLADFKAKAENTNTNEILEKVQGGESSGCHGYWGQVGKSLSHAWGNWYKFD